MAGSATYTGGSQSVSGAAVAVPGGSGNVDSFVPAPGQVVFTLTRAPAGPAAVVVNSAFQQPGDDYALNGQILTWTSDDFQLAPTDVVQIWY